MPCVFCRERTHTKFECTHPNTLNIQSSIIDIVTRTYASSLTYSLTRQEFIEANYIILERKYTVIDLKKAVIYLKNRVETRFTDIGIKKDLIRIIVLLSAQLFNHTFSSLENTPEHTLNEHRLTTGISRVVREILHPRVGGLEPRTTTQTQPRPPIPAYRAIPTPQYRLVIRLPFQGPINLNEQMDEETVQQPAEPTYTVFKTDKPCENSSTCAICFDDLNDKTYVYLNCLHEFCKTCIKKCIRTKFIKCSLCRADITEIHTQEPVVTYSI